MDREGLKKIDEEILDLLKRREDFSIDENGCGIPSDEDIIDRACQKGLNPGFAKKLFDLIDDETRHVSKQRMIAAGNPAWNSYRTASYLGPVGTYSYQAMIKYARGHGLELKDVCCSNFLDQISNVRQGVTDLAFLPIENTSSGIINDVLDLMNTPDVAVIGEVVRHIVHCLLMTRPENADRLKWIYSHPQPIVQSSRFINSHYPEAKYKYCDSTADAIKQVKELDSDEIAAIGSEIGGELFGLKPVVSNIANQTSNYTRFIVIAREPVKLPGSMPAKTSISFTTANEPGALSKILDIFRKYNYNMTKLTSRPIIGRPWEEQFYADFMANLETSDAQKALDELKDCCKSLHILGCYPVDSE